MKEENLGIMWTPEMSVFDEEIDNQHKILIDSLKKLGKEISLDGDIKEIIDTVDVLKKYTKKHLDYEEEYMKKHKFPQLAEHIKKHLIYRTYFKNFKKKLDDEVVKNSSINDTKLELLVDAERFLSNWLVEHIILEDHKYAAYIKKNE